MGEIACDNCQASCCQGGTIELTWEEAAFMIRGGNKLKTIAMPVDHDREEVFCPAGSIADPENPRELKLIGTMQPLAAGLGRYLMHGACVYLEDSGDGYPKCSVYDERPFTCQRFEVGGDQCVILRQLHGVDEMTPQVQNMVDIIESEA